MKLHHIWIVLLLWPPKANFELGLNSDMYVDFTEAFLGMSVKIFAWNKFHINKQYKTRLATSDKAIGGDHHLNSVRELKLYLV